MSRQIQIRRGSEEEHENFTGAIGEITMDTTNNTLRVHDGETAGGTVLAKKSEIPADIMTADYVTETWRASDGSSWYRKYKSGWVEQGGVLASDIIFEVQMQDNKYTIAVSNTSGTYENFRYYEQTSAGFKYKNTANTSVPSGYWQVFGFAAE